MKRFCASLFLMAIALAAAAMPAASEDGYPTRPIRLVVGFPPGGPTDVIGA